jgi:hypothetical protein
MPTATPDKTDTAPLPRPTPGPHPQPRPVRFHDWALI